jgi:UDP-glucuronate 4-epimerase
MTVSPVDLSGKKILVTGPTGQVALPLVEQISAIADVYALARFRQPEQREQIERLGATALQADLADSTSLAGLPDDFDYVMNFAVVKSGDFEYDLAANAEGLGHLMVHCRKVKAFLHFSSTAVYEYVGHEPRRENAPLGDNHRVMFPTYSISKIAAETVCRFVAREHGIPTTIARLSGPYGDNGGWMYYHMLMMQQGIAIDLHPDKPNYYNPLHADDYIEKIPYLLGAASTDVTTVNFGGSQKVSIEEWCAYLSELTGFEPVFNDNPQAVGRLCIELDSLIGETSVDWRDGIRRQMQNLAPELLKV